VILLAFLSKISEGLKRLFSKLGSKESKAEYARKREISYEETKVRHTRGLVNTLKIKKTKLVEQRHNIHMKIKSIEEKYKEGKISIDERDEQILKLLKKGVRLRKEIEKISREISKLEKSS